MERYKDLNTQLKLAKVFKAVISAGLIAPVFVSVSACEKAKPVVEEAQATATIPTTLETTPQTTPETTPETTAAPETTVVETTTPETTGPIEYKGVMINPIEGLRFEEGSFFTIDNRYNLPPNTEAGKIIFDAFELNKKMENSIALRPEVIERLCNKILNEEGKILVPLPFDFTEAKDVKIEKVKYMRDDDSKYPFEDTSLLINAPVGTKIYPPLETELVDFPSSGGFSAIDSSSEPDDGFYSFWFDPELEVSPNPNLEGFNNPLKYEGFEIPSATVVIWGQGIELSPQTFREGNVKEHPQAKRGFLGSSEFSSELAEVVSEPKQELGQPPFFSGFCSIEMYLDIREFGVNKTKITADEFIQEINGVKVSILAAQ
jgi:hypothetical protein